MKSYVMLGLWIGALLLAACGGGSADERVSGTQDAEQTAVASDASQANEASESTSSANNAEEASYPLGKPRDDLERFYGIYGDADHPGRDFFVAEAEPPQGSERDIPPGYLMIGAMWGDVAPWYMKSLSDTEFEQQWVSDFQDEPVVVEFELGDDGNAVALLFKTMFTDRGRLERLRDLPEKWQ